MFRLQKYPSEGSRRGCSPEDARSFRGLAGFQGPERFQRHKLSKGCRGAPGSEGSIEF